MPKSICPVCRKGEITEIPMDPEGIYTYPLCSNDDCPTNSDPHPIQDPFIDMDDPPPSLPTDREYLLRTVRAGLESMKGYILKLIEAGDVPNARSAL